MYIRIRNLEDDVVNKIDKMAKDNGMSRNKFLKKSLEKLVELEGVKEVDLLFSTLIKKNIGILDLNTKALSVFCDENIIDINSFFES